MGKDLKGKELGRGLSQRAGGASHARFTDKFGKRHSLYNKSLTVLKQELKHAKEEVDRKAVAEPQRGVYATRVVWAVDGSVQVRSQG